MKIYRAGVIGVGGVSSLHTDAYMALPHTELVAAADLSEAALSRFTEKYGIANVYTDYRRMLDEQNLDIVSIPTGANVRHQIVLDVAESRSVIGTLIEKPMAIDLMEADAMIAACEKAGTKLAINHQRRCDAQYRKAKQLIDDGAIGELKHIRVMGVNAGFDMTNNGTHLFDAVRIFGEDAEWVWASVTIDSREITASDVTWADRKETSRREALVAGDRVSAVFSFKNGARAFFESSREGIFGVELTGTSGRLVCIDGSAGPYPYPLAIWITGNPPGAWQPIEVPGNELNQDGLGRWLCGRMITELIRAIETGSEHPSSGYQGRAALELILGIYESQKQGKKVSLPLAQRAHPLRTL
ncbi:Gfo/Idh/MocA family oxidoreductase [Candidatus Poribacteria bacterium]|nr:Gfo/Idh/MocA family oxidoreductase [Candidatus Poribacteria bacterium]